MKWSGTVLTCNRCNVTQKFDVGLRPEWATVTSPGKDQLHLCPECDDATRSSIATALLRTRSFSTESSA